MSAPGSATDEATCAFWLFGYGSESPRLGNRVRSKILASQVRSSFTSFPISSSPSPRRTEKFRISEDHRGTPDAPGRVVTLIERPHWETLTDHHDTAPDAVWGVAYRIVPERVSEVKEYLDIREVNGYSIHYTPFHPADGSAPIKALAYIGTPDNEQFIGPQDPQELARHILESRGPSGLNRDYLYRLDAALNELSPESRDHHVSDLAERVRALEQLANGHVSSRQWPS